MGPPSSGALVSVDELITLRRRPSTRTQTGVRVFCGEDEGGGGEYFPQSKKRGVVKFGLSEAGRKFQ